MKFKLCNLLIIFILIALFIINDIQYKEILLCLGFKVIISIIFMYLIYKAYKYKYYILIGINILFLGSILPLSSNSLKNNMMKDIEMYYVDKYPAKKDLINDNNFSNEGTHQKYYAKHASEIKPSALQYIEYSKNLKFNEMYYYQLCLFFEDNICMFKWNREISKEDYIHEESDYNYNKIKSYYKKIEFTKDNKEGILKRDNKFKKLQNINNLNCLYLFYGSQNGWKEYQIKLLQKIKENEECYNELNNHFNFVNENLKNENKQNLINFLEHHKN